MNVINIPGSLQNFALVNQLFPIWTKRGTRDFSCSIHSFGLSFLTLLGHHLNYIAVSELPVPRQGQYADVGDDIRSDIVWFDRTHYTPVLIAEFERYSGAIDQKKLEAKVENLLLADHRWNRSCRWLILAYWTKGIVLLPKHDEFQNIIQHGFATPTRLKVEGTQVRKLLCLQFIHEEDPHQSFQLTKILLRGGCHES
jgi:hypothetical protein